MFIAIKTDNGRIKGKISFYFKMLKVSRQAFNNYLKTKDVPWKYQSLADAMLNICSEKEELLYGCYDTTTMTVEQLKTLIWRYFISYWNNRRICSANGGLPPMIKRQQ